MAASAEPGGALAFGTNGDNVVSIDNTGAGATLVQARTDVELDTTSSVTNVNEALAQASCSTCRTVAVAIQIVVVNSSPTTVAPQNVAVALNQNCSSCNTFAYANQVVLYSHGQISPNAARYLPQAENISRQIAAVAASRETFPQMSSDLDALTQQLAALAQQAITAGAPVLQAHQRDLDQQD
jgi:putative peptide zinc metalloprotease protein